MNTALIVSTPQKSISLLPEILTEAGVLNITTAQTAGSARRLLIENDYDLCVINAPLFDESGETLACNIAAKGISEVILLADCDHFDEHADRAEEYGVITVSKPIDPTLFWNAVKLSRAAHHKRKITQKENKKLMRKIEDIRLVDKAKCILISSLSMTEPEAHKYIEKRAMDKRLTRRAVAREILKTYENQ